MIFSNKNIITDKQTSFPKPELFKFNTKVFLGGTCNESAWRDKLIPKLRIDYFNPVVEDWTPECMAREIEERKVCNFCLYTITPKMTGVYSIAEVVDDSNKKPNSTVLCILDKDGRDSFNEFQMKSLKQVASMVEKNGGKVFYNLDDVASFLNKEDVTYGGR